MPRQPACLHCNQKRKGCDHQRPCQRCVKSGINCNYLGDTGTQHSSVPTSLASQHQHETEVQHNTLSDAVPRYEATLSSPEENKDTQALGQQAVAPFAGPSNTHDQASAYLAPDSGTTQFDRDCETSADMRALSTAADTDTHDLNQQPDKVQQSFNQQLHLLTQQPNNHPRKMTSEERDTECELDGKADCLPPCQPCRAQRKGCEATRPCARCFKKGIPEECIPVIPKINRRKLINKVDKTKRVVQTGGAESQLPLRKHQPMRELSLVQTRQAEQDPSPQTSIEEETEGERGQIPPQIQQPHPTQLPYPSQNPQNDDSIMMPNSKVLPYPCETLGGGLYIIPLDTLILPGQTVPQYALLNQRSLLTLRHYNPPQRGPFPRVLVDPDWSQLNISIPNDLNVLIHIPDTEHGDFWGLWAAPARKEKNKETGEMEMKLMVENPYTSASTLKTDLRKEDIEEGKVLWSLISTGIITTLRVRGVSPPMSRLSLYPPSFLPGTRMYKVWRHAAEEWLLHYQLPEGEAYICKCRTPRSHGGRTVKCQAGSRCAFGEWHLACLGIDEEKGWVVDTGAQWWCPLCRS